MRDPRLPQAPHVESKGIPGQAQTSGRSLLPPPSPCSESGGPDGPHLSLFSKHGCIMDEAHEQGQRSPLYRTLEAEMSLSRDHDVFPQFLS